MNNKELLPYDDILKEVFIYFSSIAFSDEQHKYINTKMAQYIYAIVNDKCSIEEFCASFFNLMEEVYFMSLKISEAVLSNWYTRWWDGKVMSREEKLDPLESEIAKMGFLINGQVLKRKPKLAKSPVFYEFVRKVILDGRFERGRTGFIYQMLQKTGKSEGIDFLPFLNDDQYAGWVILALLNLKDGRFVKEAERFLEREPKHFYRRQIERYIERYKENE